ncbi:MAG: TolC family protein [Spirochaetota bacterium]
MKLHIRILSLVIILSIIPFNLKASQRKITLIECLNIALQNHPDVFIAIENNKKSVAGYKAAVASKSILIDGELKTVEYTKPGASANTAFNIPGQDTDIGLFAGLTVIYNLYDARKDLLAESAKVNIDISKIDRQKSLDNLTFNVKKSYYGYLQSKKTLELWEEIFEKNKRKADLARLLFENGLRPVLDVTKAELDMGDAQLFYERAKNNERRMKQNLLNSMGLDQDDTRDFSPVEVESFPELKYSLEDLYRLADIYNPMIRKTKLEKRIARLKISQERANHFPKVDLLLGFGYENKKIQLAESIADNFKGESWSPAFHGTIRASVPVYSGGKTSALVDSATSDYNILSYKEKDILTGTKNTIRDQVRSLDEIKKQIELSLLIHDNAERHQLLAQRSYEYGNGSLMDLQDAELSVIRARLGHLEAKYSYLQTFAGLANTIGIEEESICLNQAEKQ